MNDCLGKWVAEWTSDRKVSPEEGLLQRPGRGSGTGGGGSGSLTSEPGEQVAGGAGAGRVDTGPEKEMALTLQCQMPRKVAGVRLKVFRLFLLLLGLGSPRWVSQKSKEPPSWGAESDAPCPEGSTLMPTGEGPLQVSCAAGHHVCVCAGVCVCLCGAEGRLAQCHARAGQYPRGGEPWALGLTDVVLVPLPSPRLEQQKGRRRRE